MAVAGVLWATFCAKLPKTEVTCKVFCRKNSVFYTLLQSVSGVKGKMLCLCGNSFGSVMAFPWECFCGQGCKRQRCALSSAGFSGCVPYCTIVVCQSLGLMPRVWLHAIRGVANVSLCLSVNFCKMVRHLVKKCRGIARILSRNIGLV